MFYGKAVTILSPLLKITFTYAEKSQYYLSYCCSPHPHTRGIVIYNRYTSHNKDHPRIRGEKCTAVWRGSCTKGSPTHTRGKATNGYLSGLDEGITPAYAGKRVVARDSGKIFEDHPRIRGEKSRSKGQRKNIRGSPPHTRGKVCNGLEQYYNFRITPAYAGKSIGDYGSHWVDRDHPRIRGEKYTDSGD